MTYNDKIEMFYHQIQNLNTFNSNLNVKNYKKYLKLARTTSNTTTTTNNNKNYFTNRNSISIGHYSKLNLIVSILIFFFITNCISYVHSQESNFYFNDGDAIKVNGESNDNHLETLLSKNFFSVFSSEISILNSIENRPKDGRKHSLFSDNDHDPNDLTIAKFTPLILDFKQQKIGVPQVQTVFITNNGNEPLKLESISGSTIHFYCSFFVDKVIPSDGNSSFDVYFLARELGNVESSLYINTNKGILKYTVKGTGIPNEYKLKPILNARIPLNTSFTSVVNLHNPTNEYLQVTEVYSSDDDLHIELPNFVKFETTSKMDNTIVNLGETPKVTYSSTNKNIWNLEPYETKPIVFIRFMGRNANNHTAFIFIKTTSEKQLEKTLTFNKTSNSEIKTDLEKKSNEISFVLPIELEVAQHSGIFAPYEQIDFGTISFKPVNTTYRSYVPSFVSSPSTSFFISNFYESTDPNCFERVVDLYLTNQGTNFLTIKNISSVRSNPAIKIYFRTNIVLPPTTQQLTKVGEIRFNPLKSSKPSHNYGKIIVRTNDSNISFQINFNSDLHEGGLEYDGELTKFWVDDYKAFLKKFEVEEEPLRHFDLINTFNFPVAVFKVELNEFAKKYFRIFEFKSPVVLKNTSITEGNANVKTAFRLRFDKKLYLSNIKELSLNKKKSNPFQLIDFFTTLPKINIFTNLTNFEIPLYIHNGKLVYSKYFPENEYLQEEFQEFDLDGILLDAEKKTRFQLINYNPIEIVINAIEITKTYNSSYKDIEINLRLELVQCEPLLSKYDKLRKNDFIKKIYIQKVNQKSIIKIPPHSRVLIDLLVSSVRKQDSKTFSKIQDSFLSTDSYHYNIKIITDYENMNLPIQFKLINGSIDLSNKDSADVSKINLKIFPHQITSYPVYLKSSFYKNLPIQSIEFTEYGNLFKFKWEEFIEIDIKNSSSNEPLSRYPPYGLIKPNKTNLVGYIKVDSKVLCQDNCYLGFEPKKSYTTISSASNLPDLNDLETLPRSLIHDLWLKTFQIKRLNFLNSNKIFEALDFDRKLLKIFSNEFLSLKDIKNDLYTNMKVYVDRQDDSNLTLNYTFPIKFRFEWPKFLTKPSQIIRFGSSQIHVGSSTKNLTLHNPSDSRVLMQIMLLDSYTSKDKFKSLLSDNQVFATYDNSELNLGLLEESQQFFEMSLSQNNPKINLNNYGLKFDERSIIALIEPHETVHLKIKFRPRKIGTYDNFLLIRNNLTVLDAYHLKAEAGTADIRIDGLTPTHASIFYSKEFNHQTSGESYLDIVMSDKEKICDSMNRERLQKSNSLFNITTSISSILDYLNVLDDSDVNCVDKKTDLDCKAPIDGDLTTTWYKNREGIVLRNLFEIKNIGTTDLYIIKILLDGEPCVSQGFEVYNCYTFRVGHNTNKNYFIDIRYQPDFTISMVKKRLTLVTNIGDLEYSIRVKIPYDMLSYCHDSLPRPPLENYLFYLCFGLLSFLITIIFFSSIFESKSLVNFQITTIKHARAFNQDNLFNLKEIVNEYNSQKEAPPSPKPNPQVLVRTKSLNNETDIKQPKSPKSGRNNKHVTSPKANNENKIKHTLAKKSAKEKENDNYVYTALEIDTESKPKNDKKDQKQVTRSPTPPSPSVINNQEQVVETNSQKLKKSVQKKLNSKNAVNNKNLIKTENEKIPEFKTMSSSSSGSISTSSSSSGSSTPSPSVSISPVQFNENSRKIKQEQLQQDVQKDQVKKQQKNYKMDQTRLNQKLLVQNTINDALNTIKNKEYGSQKFKNSNENSDNFTNNNQNVNFEALLNLLSYQQQTQPKNDLINDVDSITAQNEYLSAQLKQLQQLTQMNMLMSPGIFNQEPINFSYLNNEPSIVSYDQELANILLNPNMTDNFESFSRSVSILSKRSSSSSFSRSSSRVFKPIKIDESIIDNDVNSESKSNRNSFNSTPTSDLWDMQNVHEDYDLEDTIIIDGFNPDDEYDNMVKETEKFNALMLSHSDKIYETKNPEQPSKTKLSKTYSNPVHTLQQSSDPIKRFSYEFEDNLVQKQFGPIERPNNNTGSNRSLISSFQPNSIDVSSLISTDSNLYTFNEFRLFGDEPKSELNSALDNLVSPNEIWPIATNNTTLLTNPNQAWNSVLLNDFSIVSDETDIKDTVSAGPSQGIKSLWSNDFENQNGGN